MQGTCSSHEYTRYVITYIDARRGQSIYARTIITLPTEGKKTNSPVSFVSTCGIITALFRWLLSWHHAYQYFMLVAMALFALLLKKKRKNYLAVGRSLLGQCSAWVSCTGTSCAPRIKDTPTYNDIQAHSVNKI